MMNRSPGSGGTLLRALAATIVAACVLAGCSSAGPSDLDTPEVVWPDGEPAGEFEGDSAVVALRQAFVQDAVAWNALDFSDPDLVYRWGLPIRRVEGSVALADYAAGNVESELNDPIEWTSFGPPPMEILDVETRADAPVVTVCLGREFVQRNFVKGDVEEFQNSTRRYSVEMFPDGSSVIEPVPIDNDFDDALFEQCREAELVRGVFEPEPELFSGDGSDVKFPAPAEEYGFDNAP